MGSFFFAPNLQSPQKINYYFALLAQIILQRIHFRTIFIAAFIQPLTRSRTKRKTTEPKI